MSSSFKNSRLLWILLFLATASILGFASLTSTTAESDDERIQRLRESFACPSCKGQSVAESNAPVAENISETIANEVRAGSNDTQIRDILISSWDREVLLNPPSEGFSSLVWALPIFVLVLAAAGSFLFLKRDVLFAEGFSGFLSRKRWVAYAVLVIAFACISGFVISRFLGERGVNDALSGNVTSPGQRLGECQLIASGGDFAQAVECLDELLVDDSENSYLLDYRREYQIEIQFQGCRADAIDGKYLEAIQCIDALASDDVDNSEYAAYRGWYLALVAFSVDDATQKELLISRSLEDLDRAIALQDNNVEARAWRAVVYFRTEEIDRGCAEIAELATLNPSEEIQGLLASSAQAC